jgi:type IX secretion system PorP/SprF family membrane protein
MLRSFFVLIIGFLGLAGTALAQQDAQFSHYMFNTMYYNPGYAGVEGTTRFTGIFRRQWLGYNPTDQTSTSGNQVGGTSPTSTVLTVATLLPILNNKIGAGMHFLYDVRGPLATTELQISGSYLFKLRNATLGIGVRSGFLSQTIRDDWYVVIDPSDPIYQELTNGRASQMKADLSAGAYFKTAKYYIGASIGHIPRSKYTFGFDTSLSSKISNHLYFTGGYNFRVMPTLVVTPSAFFQTDLNEFTYLFGGMATYNDKLFGGLQFRQSFADRDAAQGGSSLANDDIVVHIGMNMLKDNSLRVGYAIDFVTSGTAAKANTSHEIMLSYVLPSPWLDPKPKVRTPRYRHEEN